MISVRWASLVVGCAALFDTAPRMARAQASGTPPEPVPSCIASIPDSAFRSVPVYVEGELADSADLPMLPEIDLLAQEVAASVRASLGAAEDQLPNAEPAVTWRALVTDLYVTAYRDGRLSSAIHQSLDGNRPDSAAAHLLKRALAAFIADGNFMVWPGGFQSDSVAFRLEIHHPVVNGKGVIGDLHLRRAFALFAVRAPPQELVVARRVRHPKYPEGLPRKGVSGSVHMQFIVDTTGRAELATVEDLWPASRPRLTGDEGAYYAAFRAAVIKSLAEDRFEPARIGGCKVRQLVQMPFAFRLRR